MNLQKYINRIIKNLQKKKGTYIVEASLAIPVFIIATVIMMSIIPTIARCENIVFSTVDEMRLESLKAGIRENSTVLPLKLTGRINRENDGIKTALITEYRYLYEDHGMKDLISIGVRVRFSQNNPLGIKNNVVFNEYVVGRAFTGAYYDPSKVSSDNRYVFIFPDWGEVYHNENCTYVIAGCRLVYLNRTVMRDYSPCKLCNAKSAQIGSPVFCFSKNGRAYHLGNCSTVDRYYIEISKTEAENKGYRPCSKCGG